MLYMREGEAALTLNVVDVNDERPRFELPVYIFDVEEQQSAGVQVGVVSATDRELAPFNQFTLTWRTPVDEFVIDSKSGVIRTTRTLDHEHKVRCLHLCISFRFAQDKFIFTSKCRIFESDKIIFRRCLKERDIIQRM